jgi:membrane associated rhomboid family serine protease
MVIIPLSGKVSWKNPPFITIAVIVLNCFIYFVFQSQDGRIQNEAYEFYFSSGLARMEVTEYITHESLAKKDPRLVNQDGKVRLDDQILFEYWMKMSRDDRFAYDLENERIITPSDQRYPQWKEWRTTFRTQLSKAVSDRYGFKPADWTFLTAFTCLFLHGSFEHLLGNMIFLWLVGCVLEMGCGRVIYLVMYLIGGLCASFMFALIYPYNTGPLIGASGAIASLIGAYMVLYGLRKIKVLYSLGFYFNTAMVPAIVILPIWIVNEIFQNYFNTFSSVAYMAHVGGLIGGSIMGFINLALVKKVDTKVFDEDPREKIPGLLEEAMQAMERLNSITARARLKQILAIDPRYPGIINHLYNVEKLHPTEAAYDEAANRLLEQLLKEKARASEILRVYKEYLSLSPRPKIGMDLLFRICSAFLSGGEMEEGEKIIGMVMKKNPEAKQLPRLILYLARTYLKRGEKDKALQTISQITETFPSSHEADIARGLLQDIHLRRESLEPL